MVIGTLIANGASFKAVSDAYLGQATDWRASLRYTRGRAASLVLLAILNTVLVIIGFVALILPGVWLLVVWSVAVPALMLEGKRPLKALGRSFDLVRGRWWATFARLLAAFVLLAVLGFLIGVIAGAVASAVSVHNVTLFEVLSGIVNAVGDILTIPFTVAVVTVIYIDLRVRKEALDLELLAAGLGSPVG